MQGARRPSGLCPWKPPGAFERGGRLSYSGKTVSAYLGLPYGQCTGCILLLGNPDARASALFWRGREQETRGRGSGSRLVYRARRPGTEDRWGRRVSPPSSPLGVLRHLLCGSRQRPCRMSLPTQIYRWICWSPLSTIGAGNGFGSSFGVVGKPVRHPALLPGRRIS